MKKEQCENAGKFGICPYVTAQQLLSGKWTILIMHELKDSPRRFGELQCSIGATQSTLSSQLKKMEQEGLITRTVFPEVPPRVEYALTAIGREFGPVLSEIEKWGGKYIAFLEKKHHTQNMEQESIS
jgi:DNA-binding HxlR family transcriptional regulator